MIKTFKKLKTYLTHAQNYDQNFNFSYFFSSRSTIFVNLISRFSPNFGRWTSQFKALERWCKSRKIFLPNSRHHQTPISTHSHQTMKTKTTTWSSTGMHNRHFQGQMKSSMTSTKSRSNGCELPHRLRRKETRRKACSRRPKESRAAIKMLFRKIRSSQNVIYLVIYIKFQTNRNKKKLEISDVCFSLISPRNAKQ